MNKKIKLDSSWLEFLEEEFQKDYMQKIKNFLEQEIKSGKTIYPHPKNIFAALNYTPLNKVKVVIIWQDPYHWENQAHWLSFSVPNSQNKLPPSLKNIFKEIEYDLGRPSEALVNPDSEWRLVSWAREWVLLLNAILTVEASKAASHSKIGWQEFTDKIIKIISDNLKWVVFILWWNYAKSKKVLIDTKKHYIIEWVHPSPLSASRWFFGSKPFSKANEFLKKDWKKEINW